MQGGGGGGHTAAALPDDPNLQPLDDGDEVEAALQDPPDQTRPDDGNAGQQDGAAGVGHSAKVSVYRQGRRRHMLPPAHLLTTALLMCSSCPASPVPTSRAGPVRLLSAQHNRPCYPNQSQLNVAV